MPVFVDMISTTRIQTVCDHLTNLVFPLNLRVTKVCKVAFPQFASSPQCLSSGFTVVHFLCVLSRVSVSLTCLRN